MSPALAAFISKWTGDHAPAGAERSNGQLFLTELCDVLSVPYPSGATTDPSLDEYVVKYDARISGAGGKVSIGKIDLYQCGAFLLESKQGGHAADYVKVGTARRDTNEWTLAMQDAYELLTSMRLRRSLRLTGWGEDSLGVDW